MAANMYRVGDYVFFETSSTTPYQIRRIEELNKTPGGNVEAKVMCFYRRRDISSSLILLADKHQMSITGALDDDDQSENSDKSDKAEKPDKPEADKSDKDEKEKDEESKENKKEEIKENGETDEKKEGDEEKMDTENSEGKSEKDSEKKEDGEKDEKEENKTADKKSEDGDAEKGEDDSKKPKDDFDEKQRHQLKHRELFLSRQVETLPATHIRGKCTVTLLNETESLLSYLNKEDAFFYSLVYDPQQKTLLADKGEIRVGSKFQAQVVHFPMLKEGEKDPRDDEVLEDLVWSPSSSHLSDRSIDQFMVIARSVGTFARALDCSSTVRQPSLHMSAAAASRDVTLFHAMDTLHRHRYDTSKALTSLVPPSGPVLCRDEMEEWSASEANLFEEALDKYGKDFNDIRQDFLPWKSLKSIVEYYYMWKTTDRYVQQKRIKAAEAETKLKQVYIPNYNKPNPAQITGKMNGMDGMGGRACESCYTSQSGQWYAWGPVHMQCRLCSVCWSYWKKYGGLKMPTRLDAERPGPSQRQERMSALANSFHTHACTIGGCGKEFKMKAHLNRHLANTHGLSIRSGSPRPVMKTRAAFCLITTALTRASRQVCKDILKIHRAARQPFTPINIAAIKQEFSLHNAPGSGSSSSGSGAPGSGSGSGGSPVPTGALRLSEDVARKLRPLKKKDRVLCDGVSDRLGVNIKADKPALLHRLAESASKPPARYRFPKGEKSQYGTAAERSAAAAAAAALGGAISGPGAASTAAATQLLKKRTYEQANGSVDGPMPKRPALGVIRQAGPAARNPATGMMRDTVINQLNGGKPGRVPIRRGKTISWIDAPDDVYFFATDNTRKLRKQLTCRDFRRAARKPWRKLNVKVPQLGDPRPSGGEGGQQIVILD